MEEAVTPIWIVRTRSFWLAAFPAVLTALDSLFQLFGTEAAGPVGALIAQILQVFGFGVTGDDVTAFMRWVAPLYTMIAIQQRAGLSRPYVATRASENTTVAVKVS